MSPLNAAICTTISYTLWVEWYYIKNNYLNLRSKVKVLRRSLRYATHRLMVMHPHTKYWPISRQKCYGPDKKILSKKQLFDLEVKDQGPKKVITVRDTPHYGHAYTNYLSMKFCWIYLTLRSKVKVPQRSSWYATHCLMDMHPHTNYHWPTSKDKNIMAGQENII